MIRTLMKVTFIAARISIPFANIFAVNGTPGLGRSNPVEESSFRSPILLVPETPKFREDSVGTVTASGHSTPEPETTPVLSPRTSPEVPDLTVTGWS